MSAQVKRLLSENEDFIHNRGYTPLEKQTNTLRLNFLKKYIINSDVNLYKTTE